MKTVCIFCGSSSGKQDIYVQLAKGLGQELARQNITLVYGGGKVGLMGAIADATLQWGGKAIGVIPNFLAAKEVAHQGLSQLHIVSSMHDRKAMMANLADGFIMLPGGYGTLEEFTETLTWAQLGLHQKPMGILNVNGYFDKLLDFFGHMTYEGFLGQTFRDIVLTGDEPKNLLEIMRVYKPIQFAHPGNINL